MLFRSCVADPGSPGGETRVASNLGTVRQIVYDAIGTPYRRTSTAIQKKLQGTWSTVFTGEVDEIYAGGLKVFYRDNGTLFRLDSSWTNLGTEGLQVVIDDPGTAYRRSNSTTVQFVRQGSTSWSSIGNFFGTTITKILKSSGKLPKISMLN